ncbi:auxin-responsive protein SAUR32 [Humulus lupulus]|uniref:auxin-responsive protein SAUR32 n=1 Tax=Humulus lupulus TaxID=3486 RepID=UPI002B401257|nr:auxin-responsive protein SAUR32 [Humulus lupulus]
MTISSEKLQNHMQMTNNFHLHIPHINFHNHNKDHDHHDDQGDQVAMKDIPKGCLAVMVGEDEEQTQRFVIPVRYINHPLFMQLLKEAEEEYGFDQKGPIVIPCHVDQFRTVQSIIDEENSLNHHHHHHDHHHHHHHHNHVWCFRV